MHQESNVTHNARVNQWNVATHKLKWIDGAETPIVATCIEESVLAIEEECTTGDMLPGVQ